MAPSLGPCKFCEKEQAKYKCPTCSAPYCGLACYKPHKNKHDEEKEAQPASTTVEPPLPPAGGDDVPVDTPMDAASSVNSAQQPAPESQKTNLDALLAYAPLVAGMQNNPSLNTRLLEIYNCTQKLAFEAENARLVAQNSQFNRRGRGRGNRRHFHRQPMEWTVERGMNRGLRKIQAMRRGGKDENVDIEEWSRTVLSILEGDES
ncbi:hypothetical protein DRE_03190 [Drechslerella stenobrocha 248]|uniref:HIT-type domain-containing protein n=1 Tax=Drechslerella stenobrocha 248 TaxID=1043628 RepID=W7IEX1_9PEZI|nr:hypothetical protein DRE_03190 [Drechslerella stenobrocha 248]